jgi:hypothetical protein
MNAATDKAASERGKMMSTMVGRTKINWDDSKMKSTYANVCNVAATREEVMLLFGTNQAWTNNVDEVTVELVERVILNPFAAKRLLLQLAKTLDDYEKVYGTLTNPETPANKA